MEYPQRVISAWELLAQNGLFGASPLSLCTCVAITLLRILPPGRAPCPRAMQRLTPLSESATRPKSLPKSIVCLDFFINDLADRLSRKHDPATLGFKSDDYVCPPWPALSCDPGLRFWPAAVDFKEYVLVCRA